MIFFQPNQQRFDSYSSAYKRKASQSNCAAAIIPSDSVVLQAYLTIMRWACGAEMPLPPYLAKGSCFVPEGTAVVPIWVPISTALVPAICRVAAATSPVGIVRQHPVTFAGSVTLRLLPKPASQGRFPCWVVVQCCRISLHDRIEACFPRNGKLNRPSVSDVGRRGGNHWPSSCQDGSSNFTSSELACAFSSSKPKQVPKWLDTKRSSSFSHRNTCQSVA